MIDDELRALVSVEPAADFQARVRTRIAAEPSRAAAWNMPLAMLAAAATIAAVVGPYWLTSVPGQLPSAVLQSPPITLAPAPVQMLAPAPHTAPPVVRRTTRAMPRTVLTATAPPAVQIDRAESAALQRLFSAPLPAAVVDLPQPRDGFIDIPQIALEPLVVDESSEGVSR